MVVTTPRKPRSPVIQRAALGYDVIFSEPVDAHSARFPCMTSPLGSQAAACEGTFHQSAKPCYNRQRILLWRVVSSGLLCRIKPLRYSRGGFIFFAYRFSSGMVFLICSAIHFEPPSSLRHSLRSMRSARNTSPTRPTGRSEVRGERLKPGSTSARLKARKKPRGDDPRGFLVDKIGAKIGAKPKLPSGSLLPQRILAEKGSVEPYLTPPRHPLDIP